MFLPLSRSFQAIWLRDKLPFESLQQMMTINHAVTVLVVCHDEHGLNARGRLTTLGDSERSATHPKSEKSGITWEMSRAPQRSQLLATPAPFGAVVEFVPSSSRNSLARPSFSRPSFTMYATRALAAVQRRNFVSTVLLTRNWENDPVNVLKREAKKRGLLQCVLFIQSAPS